jgi:hypothetical protein
MATTTNYGWTTPDNTDLVKDGASAIRTLGSSIDTTLKAQIDAQIPDSLLTTKGDLIAATGASTPARLAIGATNGHILTVDSTAATGMKWAAPAGGGKVLQVIQGTTSTSTTIATTSLTNSGITATITPRSASSKVLVLVNGIIFTQRLIAEGPQMEAVLLRDSTTILDYQSLDKQFVTLGSSQTNQRITVPINMGILDTPATTSAITYKVQGSMAQTANTAQVIFQPESTPSTIILMEIGA